MAGKVNERPLQGPLKAPLGSDNWVSAAADLRIATYWLRPSRWNAESSAPKIASQIEVNRRRREERLTRGAWRPSWGPKRHSGTRRYGISESITFDPRRSASNHHSQIILGDEMMSLIAPGPQKARISTAFVLALVTPTGIEPVFQP
jgi:hypothetical protein